MPKAKNGADRGFCDSPKGHRSRHGNSTCPECGKALKERHNCRDCARGRERERFGQSPKNIQHPGEWHKFPCGCEGYLPLDKNQGNKFVHAVKDNGWGCRITYILMSSRLNAKQSGGYAFIPSDTPHSVIRKMMEDPNCERCGQSLKWEFGRGKTPHLHHDHDTGEIYGFTHSVCNPRAEAKEIDRLKKLLRQRAA